MQPGWRRKEERKKKREERGEERKKKEIMLNKPKRAKEKPIFNVLSRYSQRVATSDSTTFSRFMDLRAESIDFTTPAIAPVT